MTLMLMAASAAALSLLEDGVVARGGAVGPVVVVVRELVGDAIFSDEDAEVEEGDADENEVGDEIPLLEDRPGTVELETPVGKLVILGPHVCGDMASFDVIAKTGVLAKLSPAKSSSCM